jgi:hypothetical protein
MSSQVVASVTRAVLLEAMRRHLARGTKTEGTYRRQVWRVIRDLFNGEIDEFDFVDDMSSFIDNQFERAWRQGAREMGVNPNNFTEDDIDALAERIAQEKDYMLQLADDILRVRAEGQSIEQFRSRADMWSNRYNDIVNEARIHFGGKRMLRWTVGPTEHCADCSRLNGIVASADDWAASGWRPQSRDLECNGYNCQCSILPTEDGPSEGGIPAK